MEIAKNVRDFLVGMKETLSPEEDQLLSSLQTLHEQYLRIMDDFSLQVSEKALSMSPEARVNAHQLRLKVYQDWRAKLMERVFDNSKEIASAEDAKMHEPGEWAVNQQRDTLASHLGHSDMLAYFAVAENESMGRVRYNMLEKMLQPCGPPPQKEEE
ncbi:Peroxisomal multifunctional enzyme type 2 [Phytophthora nicotianae]|uniref:Peroxisomal multifunctional enzyme type 2 n=1 Tax=Phytophthora nicotianae TaxID=4792 RepID=A0A0W8DEL2_PHYNI|nr:Peroxisomal multifunctional enzyme type 2 [Phytophthora nicotianae]